MNNDCVEYLHQLHKRYTECVNIHTKAAERWQRNATDKWNIEQGNTKFCLDSAKRQQHLVSIYSMFVEDIELIIELNKIR